MKERTAQQVEHSEPVARANGGNVWIGTAIDLPTPRVPGPFPYSVLTDEETVGEAMFRELACYADSTDREIVIVLLGGRGAQAMYRRIRTLAEAGEIDRLLARLHVFTQDALAPLGMKNSLSFVRDFERLLGPVFFSKIKSFTPIRTDNGDLKSQMKHYVARIRELGGIDIFFLGFGPEADAASHVCYIKPGAGAHAGDWAGIIPVSESILGHHIRKFKAGGSTVSDDDEAECRRATHILTLGPAAILGARKIVQSIVDASTAPGKIPSFKRFLETNLAEDPVELAAQCDENPGLWLRLHPNVSSFVLPDLLS